jgi:hypothetical protein
LALIRAFTSTAKRLRAFPPLASYAALIQMWTPRAAGFYTHRNQSAARRNSDCADLSGAEATAKLIEQIPGEAFAAGDNAYPSGTAEQFRNCYAPTWGRFRNRTRPSPGNHEFHSGGATPYFDYFGLAAGDPRTGYYSYDLGTWHIVVLNSECDQVAGCQSGSVEERWLRQDLAGHPSACTLAYWHKPLFSSGAKHGK